MRRGDLITIAVSGDCGKPRPALVIQSDFLTDSESVLVCLLTTTLHAAPLYRLSLPATEETGLREPLQVMVDKVMAVRRDRCGAVFGRIDQAILLTLGRMLAFAIGIAD